MKLLRARIENYRLLKSIELDFSVERDKNLTVIRAANESGKTTLLTALQWGLFGDRALPDGGQNYRLSPLDASSGDRASVTISVEIDFSVLTRTGTRDYRVIRLTTEAVQSGDWKRSSTSVDLFQLTPTGANRLENPDAHLAPHLPEELREVFFTDGDRALSFIEGAKGDQMKRVQAAIRSLLGLDVIEKTLGHVRKVSSELNQKVKKEAGSQGELIRVSQILTQIEDELPGLEAELQKAREAEVNLEQLEAEADRKLSEGLRRGNRDDLERARKAAVASRQTAVREAAEAARDHSNLFKSELLGRHLLGSAFASAKTLLDRLHDQGKIPNQTIPVLEDRLNQPTCICGEPLHGADVGSVARREHIQHLIEASRNSDAIQKKVTELYYGARQLLEPIDPNAWSTEYGSVFARRQSANKRQLDYGQKERDAEAKIADLPDIDTQQLQATRNRYRDQLKEAQAAVIRATSRLDGRRRERKEAEDAQKQLLAKDEKGLRFISELNVAQDLQSVLMVALDTMKTLELRKVSERMNELFLEMIGADASQRSIIARAGLTDDFRIVVYGKYDQQLDPSQDINGASRRALTIAFILALTKVSEVEAPNVIDTPLGMTSGYVKTSILLNAIQQSSQLILFLTHDEIKGCEAILDRYAGRVHTITNPAHYPKILLNDPGIEDMRVVLCKCDHRKECEVCARRESVSIEELLDAVGA